MSAPSSAADERGRDEHRVIAEQLHGGAAVLRVGGLRAHGVEQRRPGGRARGRRGWRRPRRVLRRRGRRARRAGRRDSTVQKPARFAAMTSATSGRDSRQAADKAAQPRQPSRHLLPALLALERFEQRTSTDRRIAAPAPDSGSSRTSRSRHSSWTSRMSLAPIASRMPSSVATVGGSSARSNAENSAKLRAFSRSMRVSLRAWASSPASCGLAPRARVHARLHERQQRRLPLGRKFEARERGRDHLRRGRFEIEEQAERLGQVDVGEVPEHRRRRSCRRGGRAGWSCAAASAAFPAGDRARRAPACRT